MPHLIALLSLFSAVASAQTTVTFEVDPAQADRLGVDPSEIEDDMSAAMTDALQLVDPSKFMVSMAEAASIAGKGLGVDYASNPQTFVVGGSIATGANANGFVLDRNPNELPAAGFAAQTSLMAGINLGLLAGTSGEDGTQLFDRFVISAHGLAFRSPAANRGFRGYMMNYGGHVTVKVVGQAEKGILDWGGLDVTTGYEHATYRLEYTGEVPFTKDAGGSSVTWDATGLYTLSAEANSVPIELSTNARVSVVTLFLGAGVDINTSSATGDGSLTGPISAEFDSGSEAIGTGTIANVSSGSAEPVAVRGFGGVQINILPVKLYAALQGSSRASASLQAGIRVAL